MWQDLEAVCCWKAHRHLLQQQCCSCARVGDWHRCCSDLLQRSGWVHPVSVVGYRHVNNLTSAETSKCWNMCKSKLHRLLVRVCKQRFLSWSSPVSYWRPGHSWDVSSIILSLWINRVCINFIFKKTRLFLWSREAASSVCLSQEKTDFWNWITCEHLHDQQAEESQPRFLPPPRESSRDERKMRYSFGASVWGNAIMLHGSMYLEIDIWNMFDCQVDKTGREQWNRVGQCGLMGLRVLSCWEQRLFSLCSSELRCTDRAGRAAAEPYSTRVGALCHQATTRRTLNGGFPVEGLSWAETAGAGFLDATVCDTFHSWTVF